MAKLIHKNNQNGFVVFMAVVIAAVIAVIAAGIVSITEKGNALSGLTVSGTEALYAADQGLECLLYADRVNDFLNTGVDFMCGSFTENLSVPTNSFVARFETASGGCAEVRILRDSGTGVAQLESRGFNACVGVVPDLTNPRLAERVLEAEYVFAAPVVTP